MKKFYILFLSILLLIVPAVVSAEDAGVDSQVNGLIDWNKGVVQATGIGYPPSNAVNSQQAFALSRRAAVLDAYRNLLETAKGVRVDSETTINNLEMNDIIKSKVSGIIRGAHVVSEQQLANDVYQVILEIKLFGDNGIAAAVIKSNAIPQQLPEPTAIQTTVIPATAIPTNPNIQATPVTPQYNANMPIYTGLVIDARGLGLERLMCPRVFDDKERAVYGYQYVDPKTTIKYGMADYATDDTMADVTNGKSRAGAYPLIIKATAVRDFSGNAVVSEADANKILIANKQNGFLTKTAVVFVQ